MHSTLRNRPVAADGVWRCVLRPLSAVLLLGLSSVCGPQAAEAAEAANVVDLTEKQPVSLEAPPSWSWGKFHFATRAAAGAIYDDNIQASTVNPKSDLRWTLSPELRILGGDTLLDQYGVVPGLNAASFVSPNYLVTTDPESWPAPFMMANYRAQENIYTRNSGLDGLDQFALINAVYPLTRLALGLKANYNIENQTTLAEGLVVNSSSYGTTLSGGYQLGAKSSVELSLSQATATYDSPNLFAFREWSADLWSNYRATDYLVLGLGLGGGMIDVFKSSLYGQTYEHLLLRGIYRTSERTDVSATFGADYRQFNSGTANTFSPYISVGGNWRITDYTTANISAIYQNQPSASYGINYTRTGFTLGGRQKIGDNMGVSLSFGYYMIDYTGGGRGVVRTTSTSYFTANAGYDINLTQYLRGRAYYQFYTVDYTTSSYDRNQVGLQLTWGF